MLRKLLILVGILLALGVAADFGVRLYSEHVVADELQKTLKLDRRPSVSFGGWPFVPHLISGNLPSATVSASELAGPGGVRLTKVSITLRDLRFPSHRLLLKGAGTFRARSGSATATFTSADLNATLKSEGLPLAVKIADGHATADVHGTEVSVNLRIDNNSLVIAPSGAGGASARLGLPVPVQGLRYTRLILSGDEIELLASIRNAAIVIPG
jgi:hypothetical protein